MQPAELCKAIRHTCVAQHWYGPDNYWRIPAGEERLCRIGFALPALSEEQAVQAEATLGFPLPPVFRTLYTELANGGFGPYYGLLRLTGDEPSENDRTVVEWYQEYTERCIFFDLDRTSVEGGMTFADSSWPRCVVSLCEEGCGNFFCLHATTGHILTIGIWDAHEYHVAPVADSLEQWLMAWVADPRYPQRT